MNLLLIIATITSVNSYIQTHNVFSFIAIILSIIPIYFSIRNILKIPTLKILFLYILQQILLAFNKSYFEEVFQHGSNMFHGLCKNNIDWKIFVSGCQKNGLIEKKYFNLNEISIFLPYSELSIEYDIIELNINENIINTSYNGWEILYNFQNIHIISKNNVLYYIELEQDGFRHNKIYKFSKNNIDINFLQCDNDKDKYMLTNFCNFEIDGSIHVLNILERLKYNIYYDFKCYRTFRNRKSFEFLNKIKEFEKKEFDEIDHEEYRLFNNMFYKNNNRLLHYIRWILNFPFIIINIFMFIFLNIIL